MSTIAGGQGDTLAMGDDHHVRAGAAMVRRAVREDWPVAPEIRDKLPGVMMGIAQDDKADPRARVGAGSVLVAMTKVNQSERHHEDNLAQDDKHLAVNWADMLAKAQPDELVEAAKRLGLVDKLPPELQELARDQPGA